MTMFRVGLWLLALAAIAPAECVGGGLKRRLEQASALTEGPTHAGALVPVDQSSPSLVGGVRRRLAAVEAPPADTQAPLYLKLMKEWAKGKLSSRQVQDFANDAFQSGAEGLQRMGAVANEGKNPQNAFRALRALFGQPANMPAFKWIEIPTVNGQRTPHPFILPHELFSSMYLGSRDSWKQFVAGETNACFEYWLARGGSEFVVQHPVLQTREHWATTVPIGMHGDGAPFSDNDSLYTFTWNSLLAEGSSKKTRFLFTVIQKSDFVPETLDAILRIFAWSCNALLDGKTPGTDWLDRPLKGGVELASGWRAAICEVRGDWAFYKEVFHFGAWNSRERMCYMCRASNALRHMAWSSYGEDAGWRGSRWSHEAYLSFVVDTGLATPVLLAACAGLRLECITVDVLHCVDQGIASHIIGNILWILIVLRASLGGATFKARVMALRQDLKEWYKATKCTNQIRGKMTQERLRADGDWPKLKAKAAATRHLSRYAKHLVITHAGLSEEDVLMSNVVVLLVRFYELLDEQPRFFSDAAQAEVAWLGRRLAIYYHDLARRALVAGQRLWKEMPKMHMFVHLCEWQIPAHGNPRYSWCYADEDIAGFMAEVAATCHPRTMAASALYKWVVMASYT